MKAKSLLIALAAISLACSTPLKDGEYKLTLLTTNDVHGHFFDSTYVGSGLSKSLMAVHHLVDSVRNAEGAENVVLVDAGDCLQGDNAAYYFNYVDTTSKHIWSRIVDYMDYDACAWGNHDVETGHPVYDRVYADLKKDGIPLLAGNAVRNDNGKSYFPLYTVVKRAGLKIAILGYTNANIKAWLSENIWSGMHFVPIMSRCQEDVDMVRKKEKPDVVIVAMHSATGKGDGSILEAEAMDVFNGVKGIDFVVCSHDHRPFTTQNDTMALVNSGSHCRYLGHGTMTFKVEKGKIVSKSFDTELIPIDAANVDCKMRDSFHDDYSAVKAFTLKEVGELKSDLLTRDAYKGMSDYINLVHTLQISCSPAQISFAAPLTYNGSVKAGTLIYNDLFTIYPFENQLFVIKMSGEEIKKYLEVSYDNWIQTIAKPEDHVLKIQPYDDPRTGQKGWSFINRSYNFDSAAGINYTVDVTKPAGERISISSMASGQPFDEGTNYYVAVTSYRASGGGGLMKAVGVDTDNIDDRVVERYPEIRNILYNYLMDMGSIDPAVTGDPARIGKWEFIPEKAAQEALARDMNLLFGRK